MNTINLIKYNYSIQTKSELQTRNSIPPRCKRGGESSFSVDTSVFLRVTHYFTEEK